MGMAGVGEEGCSSAMASPSEDTHSASRPGEPMLSHPERSGKGDHRHSAVERNGLMQGHANVVMQQIQDPNQPMDPQGFAFFKALNDPANGGGELTTLVELSTPPA
jgi:hypothetical protein